MLPFGIGIPELVVVFVVVLLVVGPAKLPELARTLAKGLQMARRAGQELKSAIDLEDLDQNRQRPWEQPSYIEDIQAVHEEEADDEHTDEGTLTVSRGPATARSVPIETEGEDASPAEAPAAQSSDEPPQDPA